MLGPCMLADALVSKQHKHKQTSYVLTCSRMQQTHMMTRSITSSLPLHMKEECWHGKPVVYVPWTLIIHYDVHAQGVLLLYEGLQYLTQAG